MSETIPHNVLVKIDSRKPREQALAMLTEIAARGLVVDDAKQARRKLDETPLHLALIEQPDGELAEITRLIGDIRTGWPELPVFIVALKPDTRSAVQLLKAGANDYFDLAGEQDRLEDALRAHLPDHAVDLAAGEEQQQHCLYRIAGRSDQLQETIDLARRVARSRVPVLITGESGTGKELLAYLVHCASQRASNPYIRVNCAALSESLLESELFGHERGAFTGAVAQRKGRFEMANRGTLLLDEISETGERLQAELLRVLEQQDFERVGGSESINVNVRIVCTSNRDLSRAVREGGFRRDLYYRIRGVQLHLPPLRDRLDDLPTLVWHFVNRYAGETGRSIHRLDEAMLKRFGRYDWPGNIRELRNVIHTALVLGEGPTLSLGPAENLLDNDDDEQDATSLKTRTLSLQDLERHAVVEALRRTNAHQAKAARMLGISDRTLRDKIRRYREDGQLEGDESWLPSRAS